MSCTNAKYSDADIVIYYNYWKFIVLILISAVFTVCAVGIIRSNEFDLSSRIICGWVGAIFMGTATLFFLFEFLHRAICNIPVIAVYPDHVVYIPPFKKKLFIAYYQEIEHFEIYKIQSTELLSLHYKKHVIKEKEQNASDIKKWFLSFNYIFSGAIESIPAYQLTVKAGKLCDILNLYLQEFNKAASQAPAVKAAIDDK